MGLAKDSERLDFFITRNGGHCGLKYWVSEQNIVQHGSEAAPSSTTSALPKIVQIPAMFRNSTLVTGSQHEVVRRLVAEIERLAHDRVAAGAEFSLALSGGQTSGPLYDALAESSLPWHHVHIWMVDERCDGSNFAVFEQRLLSRISGLRYRNIHPMPVELGDQPCSDKECLRGDEIYEKTFRKLVQGLALDFIVLGVGPDGHTASLFPGEAAAKESKRLVVFTQAGNAPGSDLAKKRMTLTLPAINAGRNVAILVVGSQKHEILQRISNSDGDDIENQYPIVDVKPHAGSLTWYVDNGAMTGID
jgi:6-phosphogluconolactonase